MKQRIILVLIACAAFVSSGVKKTTDYSMSYSVALDTAGHYLLVNLDMEMAPGKSSVTLNMPRWAPGYYEMLDFPKHLCDFQACDADGNGLAWEKSGMNRWVVSVPENGRINVSYRIYANRRDVGSSRVEDGVAFVSPPGVFMHVDADLQHPVSVRFQLPEHPELSREYFPRVQVQEFRGVVRQFLQVQGLRKILERLESLEHLEFRERPDFLPRLYFPEL